jgi:hypothetical protein
MLGYLTDKTIEGVANHLEQFIEVFRNHNHNNDNTPSVDATQNKIGLNVKTGLLTVTTADDIVIDCGFKPKLLKITGYAKGEGGSLCIGHSSGVGTDHCVHHYMGSSTIWYTNDPGEPTGYCFRVLNAGAAHGFKGAVTDFGTTSITIDVTQEGSGEASYLIYEILG